MLRRFVLPLLCVLASAFAATAHAATAWQTYLKMYTCNDILAERDTVWIATGEAGLIRYIRSLDTFESTTREPGGLASNNLTALAFDRSHRLWVGTPGKGLSRLASDRASWDLVNAFDGLPSDSVTCLRADGDTMWIGTTRGIALWDGTSIRGSVPDPSGVSPFASNVIRGIVVSGDTLFVATAAGISIARLSEQLANWTNVNTGLLSTSVTGLVTDGKQIFAAAGFATYLWNNTSHSWGLAAGNGATKRLRDDWGHMLSVSSSGAFEWVTDHWAQVGGAPASDASDDGGSEIAVDPVNHAWGSAGGTLWEQDFVTAWPQRRPPAPAGNSVQNILADGPRVYVCTFAEGVSRFDGSQWRNWLPVSLGSAQDTSFVNPTFAFAIARDRQGRKWVGNWDVALERFDDSVNPPHFDHVVVSPGTSNPLSMYTTLWSSAVDSLGFVYFGGDTPDRGTREPIGIGVFDVNGVNVATYNTNNSGILDNQTRALAVQVSGSTSTLWAGFPGSGVWYGTLQPNRATAPTFGVVTTTEILDVFGIVAHGDTIWALTTSNLLRIKASTRSVQSRLSLAAGPAPRGAVQPLAVAPDGTVYVGSVDGMRAFAPGKAAVDYRIDNSPLADNEVRAISVDPATGVLWIGTAAGLNRFDPNYKPPAAPRPAALHLKVWPNPATQTGVGFELRLAGNTTAYEGEIVDLNGRILRRFNASANGTVVWDGRDSEGQVVKPGVYFVHARGGGRDGAARVVVLR